MPEPAPVKTRLLFVDDDSGFLDMVNRIFAELSGGAWDIYLCHDAASASRLLKKQSVDLAVLVLWPASSPEGFLPALSEVCQAMRAPEALRRLRKAGSAEQVATLLRLPAQPPEPAPEEV